MPSAPTMNYNALLTNWSSKIFRTFTIVLFILVSPRVLFAQVDTLPAVPTPPDVQVETELGTVEGDVYIPSPRKAEMLEAHSPRKAAIYSAILPGLGQIYNRKYWKVPILYAGFAVTGYYLKDNLEKIDLYKTGLLAALDDDPNTENTTGFNQQQLDLLVEQYTQWRDLSYIVFGVIYVLNIIDANVDAHLMYFDVSPDISMSISPYIAPNPWQGTGLTLTLKL